MKKRTLLCLVAVVVLLMGGWGVYHLTQDPYANLEVVSDDIDWDQPKMIGPLKDPALLVVIGTFTGERERYERTIKYKSTGDLKVPDFQLKRTKSMVKVERVLKLGTDRKESELLQKEIPVIEDCRVVDNYYFSTEEYKWMNEEGRYLLILRPNSFGDGYNIEGLFAGKYDLNLKKKAQDHATLREASYDPEAEYLGSGAELEEFYKMKEEVIKKYGL